MKTKKYKIKMYKRKTKGGMFKSMFSMFAREPPIPPPRPTNYIELLQNAARDDYESIKRETRYLMTEINNIFVKIKQLYGASLITPKFYSFFHQLYKESLRYQRMIVFNDLEEYIPMANLQFDPEPNNEFYNRNKSKAIYLVALRRNLNRCLDVKENVNYLLTTYIKLERENDRQQYEQYDYNPKPITSDYTQDSLFMINPSYDELKNILGYKSEVVTRENMYEHYNSRLTELNVKLSPYKDIYKVEHDRYNKVLHNLNILTLNDAYRMLYQSYQRVN